MLKTKGGVDGVIDSLVYLIGVLIVMVLAFFETQRTDATRPVNQSSTESADHREYGESGTDIAGPSGYGKYENECRRILQRLFQRPFPKIRPSFLRNPHTGRNLELDMYNQDIALALEYDGVFHTRFHPRFHQTVADFEYQKVKDQLKDAMCKQNAITLIRVPHTVPFCGLEKYIVEQLRAHSMFRRQLPT